MLGSLAILCSDVYTIVRQPSTRKFVKSNLKSEISEPRLFFTRLIVGPTCPTWSMIWTNHLGPIWIGPALAHHPTDPKYSMWDTFCEWWLLKLGILRLKHTNLQLIIMGNQKISHQPLSFTYFSYIRLLIISIEPLIFLAISARLLWTGAAICTVLLTPCTADHGSPHGPL